jgi:NADH-quinone oxidoreductase subunit L
MFIALGAGHPEAAFFHLITHAFYKTPLFLGSGIIIDVQAKYLDIMDRDADAKDLRHMYEHWRYTPLLGLFLLPAVLSLAAVPYSAGFLSKEAIMTSMESHNILTSITYLGSFFTAIYAGRILFKPYRISRNRQISRKGKVNYSANLRLYIPIIILAFFSCYFMFGNYPLEFNRSWFYLQYPIPDLGLPALEGYKYASIGFATLGIIVSTLTIFISENEIFDEGSLPFEVFSNGFFLDRILTFIIDKISYSAQFTAVWIETNVLERIISILTYSFVVFSMIAKLSDKYVIDGFVNGSAKVSLLLGNYSRSFQSGNLRSYLIWVLIFLSVCIYFIAA